jgi:Domain of unknown function (DUF4440)
LKPKKKKSSATKRQTEPALKAALVAAFLLLKSRVMRQLLVSALLISLILSGCSAWNQPKNPDWTSATATEHLERLMWKAIRDKDWPQVERHLAAVFVGVGPRGETLDHATWMEYWKKAQVQDFSLGEVNTQPNGADMVATYVLHFNATDANQSIPAKGLRVISVWQELKGGWVLTSQSATPIL